MTKDTEKLAEQKRFIEWLKKNEMYNEYASASTMRHMQSVYDKMQEQQADLVRAVDRFLESSACTNNCDPDDMTCDTNFAKKVIANQ